MTPEKLRVLRERLGWTQPEMAKRLGISRTHLSRLENGRAPISTVLGLAVELLADMKDRGEIEELHWKADRRAIEEWQAKHPGRELIWPDQAHLVGWLLDDRERLRSVLSAIMAELDERVGPVAQAVRRMAQKGLEEDDETGAAGAR